MDNLDKQASPLIIMNKVIFFMIAPSTLTVLGSFTTVTRGKRHNAQVKFKNHTAENDAKGDLDG